MKRFTPFALVAFACAVLTAMALAAAAQEAAQPQERQGQPQERQGQPPPRPQQPPAQPLHFSSAEGSEVLVDGDSTMHKWTVQGRQIDGTIDFYVDVPADATAQQIVEAIVKNPSVKATASLPAKTLKSTKHDKTMDEKMYGALNTKKHPTLSYELTEVTGVRRESPTRFAIDTRGNLTVAGKTCVLNTPMNVQMKSDRRLEVTAKFGTLMTDFGVKPPQALGGMIKSHNKVVVTVKWSVAR
ncbi:MAG TPA: YceI family protein [Tepidisphaeraceae bacterium]|nr:YceI family protein [Tepidisphaeraceae bacterium]